MLRKLKGLKSLGILGGCLAIVVGIAQIIVSVMGYASHDILDSGGLIAIGLSTFGIRRKLERDSGNENG